MSVPQENFEFISTQMQSAYEESEIKYDNQRSVNNKLSQLQQYKIHSQVTKPIEKKVNKKINKPIKRRNGKRIKTITSHVNELYGSDSKEPTPDSPLSIVEYFSGKKRKVKEILSKFESSNFKDGTTINNYNGKLPYNKQEWEEIVRAIKENLPNLSSSTSRTLKSITEMIEFENSQKNSSLWDKASHQPSIDLTPDDLRLLYDLNSDDMVLSQGDKINSIKSISQLEPRDDDDNDESQPDEIPDSSSEPELLEYNILAQPKGHSSKIEVLESFNTLFPETVDKEHDQNDNQEIIICSSSDNSPIQSPFTTPKKSKSFVPEFKTPTKKVSPIKLVSPKLVSQFNLTPPQFSPIDSQSDYATAASQFNINSPKFKTKIIELNGDFKIKDKSTETFKIKKTGQRPKSMAIGEIEDSEDDQHDISIIEISTLMNDDYNDHNDYNDNNDNKNDNDINDNEYSIIQVPSSPGIELSNNILPVNEEINSIISTEESYKVDYTKITNSQLKAKFKDLNIKPVKSSKKMIEILQNLANIINQDIWKLSITDFFHKLYTKLIEKIKRHPQWYEKIYTYEPVLIQDLKNWLWSENIIVELDLLERFCDDQGICITNHEKVESTQDGSPNISQSTQPTL